MRIDELLSTIDAHRIGGKLDSSPEITGAFTSDLLSDVVANAKEGDLLITIQAHKNTVAVATLVGIPAICICSGREVGAEMQLAADTEGIVLCRSTKNQFEVSGPVFCLLKDGPPAR
ncbi:MAG TPA: hypothetical protein VMW69_07160 [Spirochaetia bacterium]|nr:hypothetical protein [Spirochaetia bacterium]